MALSKYEKNIVKTIKKTGCFRTSVFDPDGQDPTFSYTTGLYKTYGVPEIIIMGLRPEIIPSMFSFYQDEVEQGKSFLIDTLYTGFLDGFEVTFGDVSHAAKEAYMLSACWFHQGSDFPALQLIWPTTSGIWPWEEEASDYFLSMQPCLSE